MNLENLSIGLKRLRWRIQIPIEEFIARCINKYNVQPYGNCPVQAEGYLPSGEYYYFRARGESWRILVAESVETIFSDPIWSYGETKYEPFAAGWIGKLEVVRNFNKAMKLYYADEHTRSRENTSEVSQHGISGQTQTDTRKNVDKSG